MEGHAEGEFRSRELDINLVRNMGVREGLKGGRRFRRGEVLEERIGAGCGQCSLRLGRVVN